MKLWLIGLLLLVGPAASAQQAAPVIPFDSAPNPGNWIKSWGDRGKEPGQFNTLHSIAAEAKGNVYVADRGNHRIQVFDGDGNF
jgi:hypothetical protein